ncbi:putative 2OG-Fe(II) oxygenase [Microbulbifer aggregans]|uniref:putative 2OG-Fe(II) oxygenase n=1 Tax=Microbulbifer aggregans TaxID=1769779 RepID=UPI001CFF4208|nr:putative 2OG-Fe(II) oxygenase [Microbulbifer aggregans]
MNQVLSQVQASRYQAAMQLLMAGKLEAAFDIAHTLARELPGAADTQQLLGMCLGERGFPEEARFAFERALSLVPGNATVRKNFATFLIKQGKLFRSRQKFDASIDCLRRAVTIAPEPAFAWAELGMALRLGGDIEGALSAFEKAKLLGMDTLALRNAVNGTLQDAGRLDAALNGARKLVNEHPDFVAGQETLANILWENRRRLSPEEDPFDKFRLAVEQQPGNTGLHMRFARMLLSVNRAEEVLAVVYPLRRLEPDNPVLAWYFAEALEKTGEVDQASRLYAGIAPKWNRNTEFLNAYTRHAFRRKDIDLASDCASRAVELAPGNQESWANLGLIWRLQNDAREYWLFDYENLIGYTEILPPSVCSDCDGRFGALQKKLELMHSVSGEPVNQSVRGGSQTAGRLFGRNDPVLDELWLALKSAVDKWLATLPQDEKHPFLSRNLNSVRQVGSWSVQLASAGRHSNHIHNQGWMSSAFYVSLPEALCVGNENHAGWIQFGAPLESLGLELPPRRVIKPVPGHLALFPSFVWHGTVPFTDKLPRLTVAFDMQPAAQGS